jgi:biofilm PGA synthesis N-glycosyltransferase PgaC
MAAVIQIIFWFSLLVLFYAYIGYAIFIYLIAGFHKGNKRAFIGRLPSISLIIAGYNEAGILPQKIKNTLAINYPPELLHVIFVSDGSTDKTVSILEQYDRIQLIAKGHREGKTAALNTAVKHATSDIIVFSDANSMLNPDCLQYMIPYFADPEVGAVAGEKKVIAIQGVGEAEGLYWQYESLLKRLDAGFHSVLSATGELFALRTSLFVPPEPDIILDDFALSLEVCLQGYTIAYEPRAFSIETPSSDLKEESQRKMRIAAGAFQILQRFPWKKLTVHKKLFFQFISRRWLRWVASPILILFLALTNLLLVKISMLYTILFVLQALFYILAFVGYQLASRNKHLAFAAIPFYFLFMNYCMMRGWFQYRQKKQTVLWQKAKRNG